MAEAEFSFGRKDCPGELAYDVVANLEKLGLVVEMTQENEEEIRFKARTKEESR